jgi:hypothetical protein
MINALTEKLPSGAVVVFKAGVRHCPHPFDIAIVWGRCWKNPAASRGGSIQGFFLTIGTKATLAH